LMSFFHSPAGARWAALLYGPISPAAHLFP
jgi:hypothetical protein